MLPIGMFNRLLLNRLLLSRLSFNSLFFNRLQELLLVECQLTDIIVDGGDFPSLQSLYLNDNNISEVFQCFVSSMLYKI